MKIADRYNMYNIIIYSLILSLILYWLEIKYSLLKLISIECSQQIIVSIVIVILIIILKCCDKKIGYIIIRKTISLIDVLLIFFMLLSVEFCTLSIITFRNLNTINMTFAFIFIFSVIGIKWRSKRLDKYEKKILEKKKYSYNLSDLYNGRIKNKTADNFLILQDEPINSSSEDLLDLSEYIKNIIKNIELYNSENSYVMALIGKWGIGKTSIINLLKCESKDKLLIKKFSVWKYENVNSLFEGFADFLSNILKDNFSCSSTRILLNKYKNIVFGKVNGELGIDFSNIVNIDEEKHFNRIRSQIEDIIRYNNKKIVIVIDDLDRIDDNELKFIFSIIKNILNFKNIIYILCFDEEYVENIFTNKLTIDSHYLEKIYQVKLYIPVIEEQQFTEIGITSLSNLLKHYKIKIIDQDRYSQVAKLIFLNVNNFREIIRFINSISQTLFLIKDLGIDIIDYVALQYIKFKDLSLYMKIYKNAQFFISEDRNYNDKYEFYFPDEYEQKLIQFFDMFFEENKNFQNKEILKKILSILFPNIKKYIDKTTNRLQIECSSQIKNKNVLNRRCMNGRFFNIYFSYKSTDYIEIDEILKKIILNLNGNKSFLQEVKDNSNLIISNYTIFTEMLIIRIKEIDNHDEIFNYYLEKVSEKEKKYMNNIDISYTPELQILLAIIEIKTKIKTEEYLNKIQQVSLGLLELVTKILKHSNDSNIRKKSLYAEELLKKYIKKIINHKELLLDSENPRKIFYILYRNVEIGNLKEYMNKIINSNNIFLVLSFFIIQKDNDSLENRKNIYRLDQEKYNECISEEKVKKLLGEQDLQKLTLNQCKVLNLYKNPSKTVYKINFKDL